MLVDTVSDQTTVSFADMDLETQPDPPPDDAAQVAVAGGRFVPGRSAVAMITLTQTEGSAWSIPTEIVLLSGPAGNARLGLDVLRHMLIVIDPEEAEVRMQPTA